MLIISVSPDSFERLVQLYSPQVAEYAYGTGRVTLAWFDGLLVASVRPGLAEASLPPALEGKIAAVLGGWPEEEPTRRLNLPAAWSLARCECGAPFLRNLVERGRPVFVWRMPYPAAGLVPPELVHTFGEGEVDLEEYEAYVGQYVVAYRLFIPEEKPYDVPWDHYCEVALVEEGRDRLFLAGRVAEVDDFGPEAQ